MINLGLVYHTRANALGRAGDLAGAMQVAQKASKMLDEAQPLLLELVANGNNDVGRYLAQFQPLRLQIHAMIGQIHAGGGDMEACEAEFRKAVESFPDAAMSWQLLGRILDLRGKKEEAQEVNAKIHALGAR